MGIMYIGNQRVTPFVVDKSQGGDTIVANNLTDQPISAGDKVWLNKTQRTANTNFQIGTSTTSLYNIINFGFINNRYLKLSTSNVVELLSDGYVISSSAGGNNTSTFLNLETQDIAVSFDYQPLSYSTGTELSHPNNSFKYPVFNSNFAFYSSNQTNLYEVSIPDVTLTRTISANGTTETFQPQSYVYLYIQEDGQKKVIPMTATSGKYSVIVDEEAGTYTKSATPVTYTGAGSNPKLLLGLTPDNKYYIVRDNGVYYGHLKFVEYKGNDKWHYLSMNDINNEDLRHFYSGTSVTYHRIFSSWNRAQSVLICNDITDPANNILKFFRYQNGEWITLNVELDLASLPYYNPTLGFYGNICINNDFSQIILPCRSSTSTNYYVYMYCLNLTDYDGYNGYKFSWTHVNENTLTGIAKEDIGVGESGNFSTVLPK